MRPIMNRKWRDINDMTRQDTWQNEHFFSVLISPIWYNHIVSYLQSYKREKFLFIVDWQINLHSTQI